MSGIHQINFIPICGNERCPPCTIYVHIKKQGHDNPQEHSEKFEIKGDFGPIQGSRNSNLKSTKHRGTNENDWKLIQGKK